MKKHKYPILTIIFLFMVVFSAFMCEEFNEYRYIIFYLIAGPSLTCMGVCWYITAIMYMNDDKR